MKKFGIFMLSMILGFANLFLAFWAVGIMIGHWDLQDLLAPLLTFKVFWGLAYITSMFTVGHTGYMVYKTMGEDGDDYASIKSQFCSTLAIFIALAFSWMWTTLFF